MAPDYSQFLEFVMGLLPQLPILIVTMIGLIITLARWKEAPSAAIWSLLGLGIAFFLCFAIPAAQAATNAYVRSRSMSAAQVRQIYSTIGILWGILRAASYVFIIGAIFSGRSQKSES